MKKILVKIPAILAMLISLLSFWFYLLSIINPDTEYWEASVFIALYSLPLYLLDAIISFVKALKKKDAKFNYIITILIIASIPMLVLIGDANRVFFQVLWNLYYLAMFVLEVISIKRCIKS